MNNPSEVKDPDDLSAEQLQEQADIKREELQEQQSDPNSFDVINGGSETPKEVPEIIGDIESLSLNEKYALILHQAKQLGPLFFIQVSPDTFKLPDRDPLNLIWLNILTGWGIASNILADFESRAMVDAGEQAELKGENGADDTVNEGTEEGSTTSTSTPESE